MKNKNSVFIMSNHKNWIIEGIAKDAAAVAQKEIYFNYWPARKKDMLNLKNLKGRCLPKFSDYNLFMHFTSLFAVREKYAKKHSIDLLFQTQIDPGIKFTYEQKILLLDVDEILVQNRETKNQLIALGVLDSKIEIVYSAVSTNDYYPDTKNFQSNSPYILIVGDCRIRKNPTLVAKTVTANPQWNFIIHGRGWENFDQLFLHPPINLKLIDFELSKNPYLVRNAQALLSLSFLEGGPQTILEALASGTPVVATDTGFAADFLTGENGILLPNEPSPKLIRIAIQKALDIKNLGHQRNLLLEDFSWKKLSQKLFP